MSFVPRIRISGRKTSEKQITQEITNLLYGNSVKPYPLLVSEIAKLLGVTRGTVYNYLRRMQSVEKSETGHFKLPKIPKEKQFKKFNKHHKITSEPLIAEWMEDLTTRKGGDPIKTWKTRIRSLEIVCNTCKIQPSDLLVSQRNTEKILRQFTQLGREEKDVRSVLGRKRNGIKYLVYNKIQAVRDFCGFYGLNWRKGVGGIMSQKVICHGQYVDARLSEKELEKAEYDKLSKNDKSLLSKPWFLEYALNRKSPKLGSEANALQNFFEERLEFSNDDLNKLSQATFKAYQKYGVVFNLKKFEEWAESDIYNKLLHDETIKRITDDNARFEHQLLSDYLVSRYLAFNEDWWTSEGLEIASFQSNSDETVVMALEQIKEAEKN